MKEPITILKLGGSAITHKAEELAPDLVTIHRSLDEVARYRQPIILIHGGGSFAHPFATKARLQNGYRKKSQLHVLTETELFLDQLSRIIGVALVQRGVSYVRLSPMGFATNFRGRLREAFTSPFTDALSLGLIPLTHGDVVFDQKLGFSILSGDQLASFLGIRLGASRVLFGTDVDGVHSSDPKLNNRTGTLIREVNHTNYRSVLTSLKKSRTGDATGGMISKVRESLSLAQNGCDVTIFNLRTEKLLGSILNREMRGLASTRFPPWRRHQEKRAIPLITSKNEHVRELT